MHNVKKYMVEFQLPYPFPVEMEELIPEQRIAVHDLFMDEKLLSYTLALDRSKLWAIFLAEEESELITLIDKLPMSAYLHYDYSEIMIHETIQFIPSMSQN
jgi:hypothetical protein